MEYQLALAGGGAKGAYHVGVINALYERGYKINAVVGTSIGALNAAMVAQHKVKELHKLWINMKFSDLFFFPDEHAYNIAARNYKKESIKELAKALYESAKNKGIDTSKIRKLLAKNINEDSLRDSDINFGVMTVNMTNLTPAPTYIEDMPYGTVIDYVMASANLPGFQQLSIKQKSYRDGGLYDNLPVNMLIDRGYKNIIAVSAGGSAIERKAKKKDDLKLINIVPSEKPGRLLDFRPETIRRAIEIGYYDALKVIDKLPGILYYFQHDAARKLDKQLLGKAVTICEQLGTIMDVKEDLSIDVKYNLIFKKLAKILKIKKYDGHASTVVIGLLEEIAKDLKINRLQVLSVKELIDMIIVCKMSIRSGENASDAKQTEKQKFIEGVFNCIINFVN